MMTRQEAIDLFRSDDLIGIGMAADAVRRRLHPHRIVSYIIDRNINYTNFCTEFCSFCAFYRPMGHAEGYIHPKEVIFDKIQATVRGLGVSELRSFTPIEIFRGGSVPAGKYSILLHAMFQSLERTLHEDEVADWSSKIVAALGQLGGIQRA